LPVSLISFTAVAYNSEVRLNWATASEQDNKEFVVSRSSDGSNFTELARVPGNGTSSARNNYQYTDGAPIKGISYYKLQQVDRSGVVKELGVKAVRFNTGARVVKVYPNPVRDKVMLLMTADLYERYSVTDADGKILLTGNVAAGANQLTIDLSALAAGTYRVRLEGVGGNSVSNVVKL
jgi:predicted phage tail protein